MKKRSTFLFLFTFSALLGFSQTQSCLQNVSAPGFRTVIQVSSTDTLVREYILHVPVNYDANDPTPLVINLHGFGDCAAEYAETIGNFYNFNELADQENFLVAYPQGAYRPEKEDTYWEPGDNGSSDIYENDVYFIEQLISDMSSEFNVDMNKIYASGYSNGGMMAYSLACNRSTLFSAIGIMSGTMLQEDCDLDNSVPIIKFHGIADGVLPYEGSMWYQSVSEVVNFWLDKNNIPNGSLVSTQLNAGNVVRDEYFGGNDNACLTLYTINEEWEKPGDHVWFSEEINSTSPNKIMWDFFTGNCSPVSSIGESAKTDISLEIHPNPFSNQITIASKKAVDQNFTIHNLQGVRKIFGKVTSNQYRIDLSTLPPAIYILKIGDNVRRLVKVE